jgi:hypothetical protein
MRIINVMLLIAVSALQGCGKPALDGQYTSKTDPNFFVKFTPNGNWVNSDGKAGSYRLDGSTVILEGGLISISGTVSGDTVTLKIPGLGANHQMVIEDTPFVKK